MEIFAKRLKEERESNNYSQRAFAKLLDIPYGTYKNYELGKTKNGCEPPFKILVKIADILDVSIDYLFGREN